MKITSSILAILLALGVSSNLQAKGTKGKPKTKDEFTKLDTNRDGKLSLKEFLHGKSDVAAAEAEFKKKDTNGDGFLSKEEFGGGKKKKK